jgi:hypothetical protein
MRWTLVFTDLPPVEGELDRRTRLALWVARRLRPGFRHVYALRPAERFEGWVAVNPMRDGLAVLELPLDQAVSWTGGLSGRGYVERLLQGQVEGRNHLVAAEARRSGRWLARGPLLTCVGQMLQLLGREPSCKIITPWQLYNDLCRESALSPNA